MHGFVGESDNMTVADFPGLRETAGTPTNAALAALPDAALAQGLATASGDPAHRPPPPPPPLPPPARSSVVPPDGAGVPLDRVFLFFGQRFVIDSEVFANVVFDRAAPAIRSA